MEKIGREYLIKIKVENVSENPNEVEAKIHLEPIPGKGLYRLRLQFRAIRIRAGYREFAETVVKEIRRTLLLWQGVYKEGKRKW